MEAREYRKLIRAHAVKRGFLSPPRKRRLGQWAFTGGPLGAEAIVPYGSPSLDAEQYVVYLKGVFTSAIRKAEARKANKDFPSKNVDDRWLYAFAPDYPHDREIRTEAGKWMMFFARKYADDTWKNVSAAVRKGRLAAHAKVSTAASTPWAMPHVLCVYVFDYRDRDDAMALRERLRDLGFKRKIHFKRDAMTEFGQSGSEFSA